MTCEEIQRDATEDVRLLISAGYSKLLIGTLINQTLHELAPNPDWRKAYRTGALINAPWLLEIRNEMFGK